MELVPIITKNYKNSKEMSMKGIGKMITRMAKVFIIMLMGTSMKETMKMMKGMEQVKNTTTMEKYLRFSMKEENVLIIDFSSIFFLYKL